MAVHAQAHHHQYRSNNMSYPDLLTSWVRPHGADDNINPSKAPQHVNKNGGNVHTEALDGTLWAANHHHHHACKTPSLQPPDIDGCIIGTPRNTNAVASKRPWERMYEEPLLLNASANTVFQQRLSGAVYTGLQLATSTAVNNSCHSSPQPSTSGCCASTTPDYPTYIQAQIEKQRNEIHQLIDHQVNAMKQSLTERSQVHLQGLLAVLQDGVSKRLKMKDQEIEKVSKNSLRLEEMVKQLSLEIQLWKNLAKNNELMAVNLKQNLEQVMMQIRDQRNVQAFQNANYMSREEGCGESEVDDAESCQHGTRPQQQGGLFEIKEPLADPRKCRFCRVKEVCVLVLPCRHLCLCMDCEGQLDRCPLCGITKNASLQVYV